MTDETPGREHRDDVSLRTREVDRGRCAQFRVWWKDGGKDLVVGAVATFAALGCLILAVLVYGIQREQSKNARATATAARDGCLRSKALGPSLIKDYEIRGVLTGKNLELYRSLIPTVCPKAP